MQTRVYDLKKEYEQGMEAAAREIESGGLVVFPTETVYGIGADAQNQDAVRRIFAVKGRPMDNPLIAHICRMEQALCVAEVPPLAEKLLAAFWPGPFTAVLKSRGKIPRETTAGLDTVALRMPGSAIARELIRKSGRLIAAPSANLSGKPSGTTAPDVIADFDGLVPIILDGGPAQVGVESTVCDLTGDTPIILRPGGVTAEMIQQECGRVQISPAVLHGLASGEKAASPGMKYQHYAPRAKVYVIKAQNQSALAKGVNSLYHREEQKGRKVEIFCMNSRAENYAGKRVRKMGESVWDVARNLFSSLRQADSQGVEVILFEDVGEEGMGLAVSNRIIRAAGFDILSV